MLLVVAAAAGCARPYVARDQPLIPPLAIFAGDVIGPFDTVADGASVRLAWVDPVSGDVVDLAEQTTDRFNGYRFSSRRAGRYRLVATAPGCRPESVEFEIDRDASLGHDFLLEATRSTRISGRLIDPAGAPLTVDGLALLFPAAFGHDPSDVGPGADGVAEVYPLTGGSGLVARYGPPDRPIGEFDAALSVEDASFDVVVPAGFAGILELTFRGEVVSRHDWRDGDGGLVLAIDVDRLRASLGVIDVEVVASDGAALSNVLVSLVRRGSIESGSTVIDRVDLADVGPSLRAIGVPTGDVVVIVAAAGRAARVETASVRGGATTTLRIASPPAASARVRLLGASADVAEIVADRLEVRSRSGAPLPARHRIEWTGGTPEIVLTGAPVGDVVLVSGVNTLAVRLDAGTMASFDWALEPEYEAFLPIQILPRREDPRARSRVVVVRSERRDGLLVREAAFAATFDGNGGATVPLAFTPGRYWITSAIPDLGAGGWDRQDVVLHATDHGRVLLLDGDFEWND